MRRLTLTLALMALTPLIAETTAPGFCDSAKRGLLDVSVSDVTAARASQALGKAAAVSLIINEPGLSNRPFQLFVRNQPLGAVMQEIAAVLSSAPGACTWERATIDGHEGYRLREGLRSRQQRIAWLRRLGSNRRRQLETDLDIALRMTLVNPEELSQFQGSHPDLVYTAPHMQKTLRLLGSLSAGQRELVLSGKGFNLPYTEMTSQQQELLSGMVGGRRLLRRTIHPPGHSPIVLDWRSPEDLPKSTLTFRLTGNPERPGIRVFLPTLPGGGVGFQDALHPPGPPEGEQPEWLKAALAPQREAREKKQREREAAAAKDPDLRQKVTLKALQPAPDEARPGKTVQRYCELSTCLRQIADQTALSVVGDYDPCWDDYYSWRDFSRPGTRFQTLLMQDIKETSLWQVLGLLEDRFGVTLVKKGKFIRVTSPRVIYAEMDGIDMLEHRRPAPPHIPGLDEAARKEGEQKDPAPGETTR